MIKYQLLLYFFPLTPKLDLIIMMYDNEWLIYRLTHALTLNTFGDL